MPDAAACQIERRDHQVDLHLAGRWQSGQALPRAGEVCEALQRDDVVRPVDAGLSDWDSSLPAFLLQVERGCRAAGATLDITALPDRLRGLFGLATAVAPAERRGEEDEAGFLAQLGGIALRMRDNIPHVTRFIGEILLALLRLLRGRARLRWRDFWLQMDTVGPRALPIVSLISFLVGTILAYMGAVQLAQFGAQIYIADLVAIGMTREIAALMTGIIVAGRTGAAFAAQIGTMQVNEEIDALTTLGIAPIEHLVLPRMLALLVMMPLLTLYAGAVGIVAGMLIANLVFNVGVTEYWVESLTVLNLTHVLVGLVKASVYGALIAFAGCLRGMQCGRSAQAVGEATTSAVVTSILLITIFASLLTIMFQRLGI